MKNNASPLVAAFLHSLHEREMVEDDPAAVQRFNQAFKRLTEFAKLAERAERDRILHALVDGMNTGQSNWEFGCLANTCGMIVEAGADPTIAVESILDRITRQFERVHEFVKVMRDQFGVENPNHIAEQDWPRLGEQHPEHAWVIGEWYALRFTGCAAMAMLCRDVEARKKARKRIELLELAVSAHSDNPYAYYLAELLGVADDERLLVLDMTRRLGFRVHLTAIRNNFHLFTLLQDALLGHPSARDWCGPRVNTLAVAVARSERMLHQIAPNEWGPAGERDSAIWTYYNWHALKLDGSLQTLTEGQTGQGPSWVGGEGKPAEIPLLDGERIVLLGPLEMPRGWSVGFFAPLHSDLRSEVRVVEALTEHVYRGWVNKIQANV